MLLNTEELLALVNGDAEPDRLADLLDRLERCPDSAAALQTLVALRANREQALAAIREAEYVDVPIAFPQPAARPVPATAWALQGLRLAASVTLVVAIGAWAAISYFGGATEPVDVHALATTEYVNVIFTPRGAELTSTVEDLMFEASVALEEQRWQDARNLLRDAPVDENGRVPLYLGMAQYWLGEYDDAARTLERARTLPTVDPGVRYQAMWYEANALLALDSPVAALPLLEQLKGVPNPMFREFTAPAGTTYDALCEMLGLEAVHRND